jgi:hypothetical protein
MMMRNSRFILPRCGHLLPRLLAILIILYSPGSGEARTPPYPEINVTTGKTPAGCPYMNGGVSVDERRTMERAAKSYNFKLVFTRPAGTPVVPAFVMIGANNWRGVDKIVQHGPWFYIQLPSGAYTILAHFKRQVVVVSAVYLGEGGRKTYLLRGE